MATISNISLHEADIVCTVQLDDVWANDPKCYVLVTCLHKDLSAYDGCKRETKWADGKSTLVFEGLVIKDPGEYVFCITAVKSEGDPVEAHSDVITVTK